MSADVQPFFIITGKVTKTGKLVFWATDIHSDGYPFWTDSFASATKFETLIKASKMVGSAGYMLNQASDVKINRVNIVLEEVSEKSVRMIQREEALAKLTKEERILLGLE